VSDVITSARVDGGVAMIPVTANLALADVVVHRWRLRSAFPPSRADFPSDSLREIQRRRASAWIDRFGTLSASQQRDAVQGWQRVPFAEVAAWAGNDSTAQRLFDTRIVELATHPVEQAYALFERVATLADPTQDSARLARNLRAAESVLKILQRLHTTGFSTRHDSATILYHQLYAEDTMIVGYAAIGDRERLLAHVQHAMGYTLQVGGKERGSVLGRLYTRAIKALQESPDGRERLVAFNPTVMAIARRIATEIPSTFTADDRNQLIGMPSNMQQWFDQLTQWFARLGKPAPPITAHLWLNTPDSSYAPTPRTRTFTDGSVYVVAFGPFNDENMPAVLGRVMARFPTGVQVLFVAKTSGYVGPDIVGPANEAAWLTRYFRGVKQFALPIAIWAGDKRPNGFVPEGHYQRIDPEPSPNEPLYAANDLGSQCVVIDQHGVIRFFEDVNTHFDQDRVRRVNETRLWRRIQQLLDESNLVPGAARTDTSSSQGATPPPIQESAHVSR